MTDDAPHLAIYEQLRSERLIDPDRLLIELADGIAELRGRPLRPAQPVNPPTAAMQIPLPPVVRPVTGEAP